MREVGAVDQGGKVTTPFRNLALAGSVIRACAADVNETHPHLATRRPRHSPNTLSPQRTRAAPTENSVRMSVAPPALIGVTTKMAQVPAGRMFSGRSDERRDIPIIRGKSKGFCSSNFGNNFHFKNHFATIPTFFLDVYEMWARSIECFFPLIKLYFVLISIPRPSKN